MAPLADAFVRLRPSVSGFREEADRALGGANLGQLGQTHGQRLAAGFTGGFGSIIRSAAGVVGILGVAGIAGAAVKMGITTAASLEQSQVAFATLLGSGQKASAFLKDLQGFAARTPFTMPGVVDAARQLLGVGQSAQSVIPTLTAFGDTAGALGLSQDAFNRVMLATTQAMAGGKLQAGDLLQITQAGIPIWSLLAQALGKPVAEVRKMSEQGKLLTADVLPKLQAQMEKDYGGAMAKQSQTLAGVWSTLKDNVSIGLAQALQPLVPILTTLLPRGADLASRGLAAMSAWLAAFISGIRGVSTDATGFAGVMNRIGEVVRAVVIDVIAIVGWFRQHMTVTRDLAIAVGGVVTAIALYSATVAISTAVTKAWGVATTLYKSGVFLMTLATEGWTAAVKVLTVATEENDAAMLANPIGLIIVAIAALVVGVIYAYTHFAWFRTIVQGAWEGIQVAAMWAWNNVLHPVFDALVGIWNVVATVALWLWHNVIDPAFHGIAVVASWLWNNVLYPNFQGWRIIIMDVLVPVILWLWHNVVTPAMQAISIAVQIAWAIIRPAIEGWKLIIMNVLVPAVLWLWHNVIDPAFHAVGDTISFVWRNVIKPVFDTFGWIITNVVAPAFRAGVDAIKTAWDKVADVAKTPINFVIGFVNSGIIDPYNTIAGFFGVKDRVDHINKLATGGLFEGVGGPRDDANLALLSNREFVVNAAATEKWLPVLEYINSGGATGQGPRTRYPGDGSRGIAAFAGGGLVGWLAGIGRDIWDAITDPAKFIGDLANGLLRNIPGGQQMVNLISGEAHKLISELVNWVKGSGGGAAGGAMSFLKSQVGKPYFWGEAGPGGYDCSGIVSAVWNMLHGRSPYSHTFSTSNEAGFFPIPGIGNILSAGWSNPGESGPGGDSVGHTAGLLGGVPFESTGSGGVHMGGGVTPIGSFAHVGHYAGGGLVPGPYGMPQPAVVHGGERVYPPGPMELSDATIEKLGRAIGREISGVGRGVVQAARAR